MNHSKRFNNFNAAFTMVELLVVIVIIAVLATLLVSLTSRMKNKASSATSVSNLRQIGTAILTYTTDNNSLLPGPILTDHAPLYQNNAKAGWLGWHLKEYLTSVSQPENPKPRTFYTPELDYPAAKSGARNPTGNWKPTYMVFSKQTDSVTGATFWPMGNYNPNSSGNVTPSMTTAQLAARETRGRHWITEIDQIIRPSNSQAEKLPPHGKSRNTLMFDFSVKAVPLGEFDPS
jgi:prepilin-type N-terminal cleavage/methylation domain-containing protein